jgi:hypothetical protein
VRFVPLHAWLNPILKGFNGIADDQCDEWKPRLSWEGFLLYWGVGSPSNSVGEAAKLISAANRPDNLGKPYVIATASFFVIF